MTDVLAPLAPERETDGALSRLVDVLLDKGVHLDLDLVVTVAEVPLIAVRVRALIAGVETMIEHGVPGPWAVVGLDASAGDGRPPDPAADDVLLRSPAAAAEQREHGPIWREGALVLDRNGALRWQGRGDRRPSFLLDIGTITAVTAGALAPDGRRELEIQDADGVTRFALGEVERWIAALGGSDVRGGAA